MVRRPGLLDAEGNLVGDADTVAFEGDNFFRVIREDADVLEAEVPDLERGAGSVRGALGRNFRTRFPASRRLPSDHSLSFFFLEST